MIDPRYSGGLLAFASNGIYPAAYVASVGMLPTCVGMFVFSDYRNIWVGVGKASAYIC